MHGVLVRKDQIIGDGEWYYFPYADSWQVMPDKSLVVRQGTKDVWVVGINRWDHVGLANEVRSNTTKF